MARSKVLFCAAVLLCAMALSEAAPLQSKPAAGAGPAAGAAAPADALLPPGADGPPPAPVCACDLPEEGGGYFGRGKTLVAAGCKCKNACEIRPNGKPSCATLCDCPDNVPVQTFNGVRGPISSTGYGVFWLPLGRRLLGDQKVTKMQYTYITP